jgi:hypothetical protein
MPDGLHTFQIINEGHFSLLVDRRAKRNGSAKAPGREEPCLDECQDSVEHQCRDKAKRRCAKQELLEQ